MELEDDFDVLDPERLIQCPYNKHHRIRACRFPYHLVKCRKSYPKVAEELATCPFNARHLVPRADLSDHITKCSDKGFIEQDVVSQSSGFQRDQMNAVSTWQAPPCDEDWEAELLEQSDSPFIWGMSNSGINRRSNCSVSVPVPSLSKRIACLQEYVLLSPSHTLYHGKADKEYFQQYIKQQLLQGGSLRTSCDYHYGHSHNIPVLNSQSLAMGRLGSAGAFTPFPRG